MHKKTLDLTLEEETKKQTEVPNRQILANFLHHQQMIKPVDLIFS